MVTENIFPCSLEQCPNSLCPSEQVKSLTGNQPHPAQLLFHLREQQPARVHLLHQGQLKLSWFLSTLWAKLVLLTPNWSIPSVRLGAQCPLTLQPSAMFIAAQKRLDFGFPQGFEQKIFPFEGKTLNIPGRA